ncbi:MAG: undecaprenyl-diphosphatase UppP [Thermodesulfobacteriota bacterium]
MSYFQAIFFGIIQGLTEFLPISSTAHLLIGQQLLGLSSSPAMFSFLVLVQLGTLVSLFVFYRHDLLAIMTAALDFRSFKKQGGMSLEAKLGWYILLATIPALLAGYCLKDAVEAMFQAPMVQAPVRLFAAAILLTLAELVSKKNRQLVSMTWRDALIIGVFQVIAVFPGASRSGTTISGGLFCGFDRLAAARFAFLMSVPVMLAAGVYEMLDVLRMPDMIELLPTIAIGFVVSAVVGWLAVKWLIHYLSGHSLYLFAGYCAAAGLLTILLA